MQTDLKSAPEYSSKHLTVTARTADVHDAADASNMDSHVLQHVANVKVNETLDLPEPECDTDYL